MPCIHGIQSSFMGYVVFNIAQSNWVVSFDLLNDREPSSNHKLLTLTQFFMHIIPTKVNSNNQRHLHFDRSKPYVFLKDLNNELNMLTIRTTQIRLSQLYNNPFYLH